jgi:hypothetical protein
MIPKRIDGTTHILTPPAEGYSHEGVTSHFAVRKRGGGMHAIYESAWEPTPRDLEYLLRGGTIVLRVAGGAHPPVMLYVEAPPALVDQE